MTSIRRLVRALSTSDPSRPRLTWYGADGERVELSGRVLVNGVVKATNLLVAEVDAGPRTAVLLDLPPHWRAVQWALAAWTCGGEVRVTARASATTFPTATGIPTSSTAPAASSAPAAAGREPALVRVATTDPDDVDVPATAVDVVVTDRPVAGSAPLTIAVPLPALALRYPGTLPEGALDGVADLMTYPDSFGWLPELEPGSSALAGPGVEPPVSHADLLTWARPAAGGEAWPVSPRALVAGHDLVSTLVAALAAWAADGSVVLVEDAAADLDRLARQERVTVRG